MNILEATDTSLNLTIHLFSQEIPFGLMPKFSDEMSQLLDIPIRELTEEQAQSLIGDLVGQIQRYFKENYYGDEGDKDLHPSN